MTEAAKFDEASFPAEQQKGVEQPQVVRNNISEEELKALIEVPGIICTRFYMAAQDAALVRIIFADESSDKKHMVPRFACVMSINAFMSFAQMVQNTSNQVMQKLMQVNQSAAMPNIAQPVNPDREKLD